MNFNCKHAFLDGLDVGEDCVDNAGRILVKT